MTENLWRKAFCALADAHEAQEEYRTAFQELFSAHADDEDDAIRARVNDAERLYNEAWDASQAARKLAIETDSHDLSGI